MSARKPMLAFLMLACCGEIKQDDFVSEGGISPDPSAILEGAVLYTGAPPHCAYRADHSVERVVGRVALTLFEYDNPPPPEGSATSAINIMFVNGGDLFSTADCIPEGGVATTTITRSAPFVWPRIELLQKRAVDYQIRGFYDYDEDMNPLFSVTRLPTAGDVIGAALNDVRDASQGLFKIALPALEDARNGLVVRNLTVALGEPVRSERPAFALDANRMLSADAQFFPSVDLATLTPDPAASLRAFHTLTCATPGTPECGLTLNGLTADQTATLSLDGVQLDLSDPVASAFYTQPIDIQSVIVKSATSTGVDMPVPDGKVDPHPILGASLGIPWYAPAVIMQRLPDAASAAIEAQARIPRVLLVGSMLLDDQLLPEKQSYRALPVAVPPVAAVELVPGRLECRVPYFAPGTPSLVTDGRLANCDELPSGNYAVNLLAGVAGGTIVPAQGDSPVSFSGARYSGQSWTVPNELGDPLQVNANLVTGQSLAETFVVNDRSEGKNPCDQSTPSGICAGALEIVETADGVDSVTCLMRDCCDYVAHLCGLPACAKVVTANNATISASPTKLVGVAANGAAIPDCVPFELPWQCCRANP